MRVELVKVPRRPPWPLWAILLVLFWAALGGATILLSAHLNRPVTLCLVKNLTGVPCPTCGSTRGTLSLARGRPVEAWLYNPFFFTAMGLFLADAAGRVLFKRAVKVYVTGTARRLVWIAIIALFVANWAYVIAYVG